MIHHDGIASQIAQLELRIESLKALDAELLRDKRKELSPLVHLQEIGGHKRHAVFQDQQQIFDNLASGEWRLREPAEIDAYHKANPPAPPYTAESEAKAQAEAKKRGKFYFNRITSSLF